MLDSDAYIAHLVAIWTFSRLGALPPTNASIGLGLWGGAPRQNQHYQTSTNQIATS
jgi:hypothetical protein